jgi:hypothetical protein
MHSTSVLQQLTYGRPSIRITRNAKYGVGSTKRLALGGWSGCSVNLLADLSPDSQGVVLEKRMQAHNFGRGRVPTVGDCTSVWSWTCTPE